MRQRLRKLIAFLMLVVVGFLSVNAEELQEVVYLKNGSVIRGTIIELVPEKSLKIQTLDGSIFVYQMSEVEKITKEKPYKSEKKNTLKEEYNGDNIGSGNVNGYFYNYNDSHNSYNYNRYSHDDEPYGYEIAPRYRGFINTSMVIGLGDYNISRFMISTSHGIQITPELFAGVGIGVTAWIDYYYDYNYDGYYSDYESAVSTPVFANLRGELHNIFHRNFSPYLDVKMGYSFGDVNGVFFSPEIGMHFYFGHRKMGIGFGLGYHLQSIPVETVYYNYNGSFTYNSYQSSREIANGFSINVAFDF